MGSKCGNRGMTPVLDTCWLGDLGETPDLSEPPFPQLSFGVVA